MRIGIDMRMAGTGEGIGRYVEELVKHLARIDSQNEYLLLGREKFSISNFSPFGRSLRQFPNFKVVGVKSKYYSWQEQTRFIWELKKLKLDLVHFPNFNVPVFYRGKFILTIHDIIHHQFPGKKRSRFFHRAAYRLVINRAVKKAAKIIAVSESTKAEIVKTFKVKPEKVEVIYEGVDQKFFDRVDEVELARVKAKYQITKPYILFVGVWRQYKNLPRLALAFDELRAKGLEYQLVLAGKIDPFYPEIKRAVFSIKNKQDIRATGFVPGQDLRALYQGAALFVLPSLIEGFGLIGIEAQASGVPIAASDILVLREILGNGAVYFNPREETDMANKINQVLSDDELTQRLKTTGNTNAKKYNWLDCAKKTMAIYHRIAGNLTPALSPASLSLGEAGDIGEGERVR